MHGPGHGYESRDDRDSCTRHSSCYTSRLVAQDGVIHTGQGPEFDTTVTPLSVLPPGQPGEGSRDTVSMEDCQY